MQILHNTKDTKYTTNFVNKTVQAYKQYSKSRVSSGRVRIGYKRALNRTHMSTKPVLQFCAIDILLMFSHFDKFRYYSYVSVFVCMPQGHFAF